MSDEVAQFAELCRDETALVSRLIVFLEQEQQLLVTRALLGLKDQALDLLSIKGRERQLLAHKLGLKSVADVRAWVSDKAEPRSAWVQLEDTLQKALVLNQFNGRYIDQGLQSSQKALSVLKAAAASSMGYGRDGSQGQISFGGRHFGSA
jgi:flagella synthesis protein FlgN